MCRWSRITATHQGVEDDGSRANALIKRLLAGGLHGRDPVARHASEDGDHLPITGIDCLQSLADLHHHRRQHPVAERHAIAKSAGLAGQNRHIMPGIIDRLVAAEAAAMFSDDRAILLDDNPVCIGVDFDRTAGSR